MTNTYAINTTRKREFDVEQEMAEMGLPNIWCPKIRDSKWVKERGQYKHFDRAYLPKVIFAVIPAVYFRDVLDLKHVIGKPVALTRLDLHGCKAGDLGTNMHGLIEFRRRVDAEYEERLRMERAVEANKSFVCDYTPGQALEVLQGPFDGMSATFAGTIKHAHDLHAKIRANVLIFGRETPVELSPHEVREI